MATLTDRLNRVRQRIALAEQAAGRKPGSVKLLAVSKTRPVADLLNSINIGQHCFGESYVQEAVEKIQALRNHPELEWHFIGPIQSNKTALLAEHFSWVHSVDRLKIAQRLSHQRRDDQPPLNVCIQVNTSGEASKSGIKPEDVPSLAEQIHNLPRLRLRGLMAIPARETDPDKQRLPFRQLRYLLDDLNRREYEMDTLSMGMTDDLEVAIMEGATIVRVGTAIFGPRAPKAKHSL